MKPIVLKMSAFGPYAKKVELNFKEELNQQDIFVITGPTGAGKTTIFDGICYALYGETSGAKRKGEELRSDFSSKGDLKTEVSFTFSVKDKYYTITRAPKQQQRKKRGKGMTEVPATVELIEHDSHRAPITKDNEIRQAIQGIIGLTVDQFRKIVMIPQGDFKEFLFANTTNKEEILRKIFGTDLFKWIQENLHEKANLLKNDIANTQKEIYAGLTFLNTENNLELNQLIEEKRSVTTILEKIKEQIFSFKTNEKEQQQNFTVLEEDLKKQLIIYQEALRINEKISKKKEAMEKLKQLNNQQSYYKEKEEILTNASMALEIQNLENEVNQIESNLKQLAKEELLKKDQFEIKQQEFKQVENDYFEIDKLQIEIKTLIEEEAQLNLNLQEVKTLKQTQNEIEKVERNQKILLESIEEKKLDFKNIVNQIQSIEDYKKVIEENKEKIYELQVELNQSEIKFKDIQKTNKYLTNWQILKEKMKSAEKETIDFDLQVEKIRKHYEFQANLFFHASAIRLANELQIGQACPVCGSLEHPNPNKSKEKILTQEELKQIQKELNKAEARAQKALVEFTSIQVREKEEKRLLIESYQEVKDQQLNLEQEFNKNELLELESKFGIKLENLNLKLKELTNQNNKLQIEISHLKDLEEKQELVNLEISKAEEVFQSQKVKILTLQETEKTIKSRISAENQELERLVSKINSNLKQRNQLEVSVKFRTESYQRLSNEVTILQTNIKNIEMQIMQMQVNYEKIRRQYENEVKNKFTELATYQLAKRSKEDIKKLTEGLQAYHQELYLANHLLNQLEQELNGEVLQNTEEINLVINDLEIKKEELRLKINTSQFYRNQYEQILEETLKKYKSIQEQEEQYAIIGELAELANGRTAGKMSFETYVLSSYFDEVLESANQRLKKMTGSRYYLLRREEVKGGGRKGLDLDVYDSHTCKKRPVNTLSGGESFKASLALALGLSDTVQQNAGGIQLDTMFIDEGFGTLDSDSLEQAIDILMDLQDHGRLIGVISHVNELKERIPAKLIVQASSEGSTAYFKR